MATSFFFNGKQIIQPGVYSEIISGINNPIQKLDYGTLLIIDTGYGKDWGCGAGIVGDPLVNSHPIQGFDNMLDFQKVAMGGPFWMAAQFLFQPKGYTIPGISKLYLVRAMQTDAAFATFIDGATTFKIMARNEGTVGNGVQSATENLEQGFSFKMRAGRVALTYHLDFYVGGFKGIDEDTPYAPNNNWIGDGLPWNGVKREKSKERLLFSSEAFKNSDELKDWMITNVDFKDWFMLDLSHAVSNNTATTPALYPDHELFAGGSVTGEGSTDNLSKVLDSIKDLDYSYILSDVFGEDANFNANNAAILTHLAKEARYDKYMIIGGGQGANDFDSVSVAIAGQLDTSLASVAHGGFLKSLRVTTASSSSVVLKEYNTFFKAANVIGRILGKEPQVPGTFKTLDYDAEVHVLKGYDLDDGLKGGVLMTRWDGEVNDFIIVQSINVLQDNAFLVLEDGQSFEISVERIKQALNKGIVINARRQLLGKEDGVNRGTLSAADLKSWIENYLQQQTVTPTEDNLIITYQNVSVLTKQDALICRYEFVPNFPVNKLIITGVIIDI